MHMQANTLQFVCLMTWLFPLLCMSAIGVYLGHHMHHSQATKAHLQNLACKKLRMICAQCASSLSLCVI